MKRASIAKRPYTYKGKTEDRWVVLWTDTKGKRREKWLPNKRRADEYATRIDRELADNIHVADRATITFGKACEAWLKDCTQRHESKNRDLAGLTLRGWTAAARNHVVPRFGNVKLNKIRSVDVQNFINEKAQTYAHNSVAQMQTVIWLVLKYAVHQEWLPRNPLQDRKVRVPGTRGKRDAPEVEEVRKLLDYYFGPRPSRVREQAWSSRRVMAVVSVFCGLRLGECLGLQWPNVKFDLNEIWVRHNLSPIDGLKGPKSKAGNREIPMNPIVVKVLRDHQELTGAKSGYVIRNLKGDYADRGTVTFYLRQDLENAWLRKGAGKFTYHHLRHFAGSIWLAQGMRIQDVQRLLGHENLTTTMGIYAHQLKEDEHAKQVLATLHAKFPGIAGSLVDDAAAPPPVTIDARPLPMVLPKPAQIPAIEIAPTAAAAIADSPAAFELPADAPAWLHELLRLITQGGWDFISAADHVGKSRTTILRHFHRAGLPTPIEVIRTAREAKMKAAYEVGYGDREIAAQTGIPLGTVRDWRARHEAEIGDKPLTSLGISHKDRMEKTGKAREKQFKLL